MTLDARIAQLLTHPALWRGRSAAPIDCIATGHPALDAALPGGGWPRVGLVEVLSPQHGVGELRLLMPALAALTQRTPARWIAWIAPPFEPYAPGLVAQGLALERQLVVRTDTSRRAQSLWVMEQSLGLGACDVALAWVRRAQPRNVRRLQLATERGRALGFLFRALSYARESSPAALRIVVEPRQQGVSVTLLKSRGGARGSIVVEWKG